MSRISFPRSSGLYNDSGTMRKGFGMTVTLASAAQLLKRHGLLREIIRADRWTLDAHDIEGADTAFSAITYDTRDVREGTLLCCKGRFKAEYLHDIDERGLAAYVADTDFSAETGAPGLIVNDARKAMSLLSAEFYGRPQDELTVVGITGTKGKTTTAYFTQAVLNAHSHGKAALFSSVDNCLDGHTYVESDLTTPESMDAFRMMREAADNGMKYLVMEVSSQAYKVERVYGLTFDVATFLNISPDHISPIEHPTFEDYLYCKRQIVRNSRALVLGAASDHADLLRQDAADAGVPVTTFELLDGQSPAGSDAADVTASPANAEHSAYRIAADGADLGEFRLALDGDFNYANAAAALAIAHAAGIDLTADAAATHAIEPVRIAGRSISSTSGSARSTRASRLSPARPATRRTTGARRSSKRRSIASTASSSPPRTRTLNRSSTSAWRCNGTSPCPASRPPSSPTARAPSRTRSMTPERTPTGSTSSSSSARVTNAGSRTTTSTCRSRATTASSSACSPEPPKRTNR